LARIDKRVIARKGCTSMKKVFCRFSDITPNPFHMPGQKQVGSLKLPSLGNGFVTSIERMEEDCPEE
jgi:hypothetical protein